jgi:hypothetical protein
MNEGVFCNAMQVWRQGEKVKALETWLILEYCNHGSLDGAIERGKFDKGFVLHGKRSRQPYLPSIGQVSRRI